MDSIRARFLWQGAEEKFRYHMAKWEMVARPKDQGGLGIINTRLMNECLVVKWIWKIMQEPNALWFKILKAKYLDSRGFFYSNSKGSSQFWQGLHKVKHLFKWGAIYKVENGQHCRFWHDVWIGTVPLKIQYEELFRMVQQPNCSVADCCDEESWELDFKRTLSLQEYNSWLELKESLGDISLSNNSDSVFWALEKNKVYSTKSLYRFLSGSGVTSRVIGFIWKSRLPLKIKFFLWQIFNNKLQVAKSLVKRGWHGSSRCCLCTCLEDIHHIMFTCHLARLVWGMLQDIYCLQNIPKSLGDFSSLWLLGKGPWPKRLIVFVFASFAWALWTCRNKMRIEKKFPKVPTDVIYTGISFMQQWSYLLKEDDRERINQMKEDVLMWLKEFKNKSNTHLMSDIVEF